MGLCFIMSDHNAAGAQRGAGNEPKREHAREDGLVPIETLPAQPPRQASAPSLSLVICAVPAKVMNVAKEQSVIRVVRDECVGIPLGHYLPAESRDVFGCTGEHIEILNPSDQIESLSGLLNIGNILSSYCGVRWRGSDAEGAVEFWTKQSSLRIAIGKIEIKI